MNKKLLFLLVLLLTATTGAWAQEPAKYKVTLQEGTEDASNWQGKAGEGEYQALPLTGLEAGTAVTVKYNGTKKVLGMKAEKKAAAPAISFNKVHWGYVENAPASFISVSQTDAKAAADAEKTKVNAPGYVCFYALEGGQYKWIDSHGRTGQGSDLESIVNGDAWAEVYECYNAGYDNCIWFTVSQ